MGHGCGKRNKTARGFESLRGGKNRLLCLNSFFFSWSRGTFSNNYEREGKKDKRLANFNNVELNLIIYMRS